MAPLLCPANHLGPPCSSFSVAVTPPRRTKAEPYGKKGLSPAIQAVLDIGNTLMLAALEQPVEIVQAA